ncbi:MAG: hypothetical protein FWF53_09835 [Candidatus Azobacteroides sp.]|nr:hypothetical protein [Candidatus Azobacteroides sp.]
MKKLAFFSSLLVTLMVVLGACSSDDKPSPGQETVTYDLVSSGISVNTNTTALTINLEKSLTDVLVTNKDKASYVKEAQTQQGCSLKIEGQGFQTSKSLGSVTINLMDGQKVANKYNVNLNSVNDSSGLTDTSVDCLNFLASVASRLATKKSISLQIVFTGGDQNVTDLTVTMTTKATFSW